MSSSLQPEREYRTLRDMSNKGSASSTNQSIDSEWSKVLTILSIMNNARVSVDGNPPMLKLVDGLQHPSTVFTLGTKKVYFNEEPITLCYFSLRIDDVTYYVRARGNVALQSFPNEPDINTKDGRLFEISMNKNWTQFKSFGTDVYLCHNSTQLRLRPQTDADRNPFNFNLIDRYPLIRNIQDQLMRCSDGGL